MLGKRVIEKDNGTVKLWEAFKGFEFGIYCYILAFCRIRVSNDRRVIAKPKEPEKEIRTKEQKVVDSAGSAILGNLLGIPGISLLAKWEERDDKRRLEKLYTALSQNAFENSLEEIMAECRELLKVQS